MRDLLKNVVVLAFLVACALYAQSKPVHSKQQCDMLIISTYSSYYRWSNQVIRNVTSAVEDDCNGNVEVIHLPMVKIHNMVQYDSLENMVCNKMLECRPRCVMLVGSGTATLCEKIDSVSHDIPMISVSGANFTGQKHEIVEKRVISPKKRISDKELAARYNITMQTMPLFLKKEIALIHRLMPLLENIYLLSGNDQFSHTTQLGLQREIDALCPRVKLHTLESGKLSTDSLINLLSGLDNKHDAVIYSSWIGLDTFDRGAVLMNSAIYLLDVSKAPAFILRDNGWMNENCNVVGGCLLNEKLYYTHLRQVVKDVFNGVSPKSIPNYADYESIVKLDYKQLEHYDIDKSLVPPGALLINAPKNIWQEHGEEMVMTFSLFLVVLLLVAVAYMRRTIMFKELKIQGLETNHLLSTIAENMPIVYFRSKLVQNKTGEVTDLSVLYGNKNVQKIFHSYGRMSKGGSLIQSLPKSAGAILSKINTCIAKGDREFEIVAEIWNGLHYMFFVIIENSTAYVFGVDISEVVNYQTKLEQANKELAIAKEQAEASERMKVEFVQNMSHEIRTPLNAICGFVSVLTDPDSANALSSEEREEYVRIINHNSELLMTLVNDILDFSDLNSGKAHITYSTAYPNELCRLALRTVEFRNRKGLDLRFVSHADDNYSIVTDGNRVQQVLVNYLTNALKHTDEGSVTLEFKPADANGWCEFSCSDTGEGVPPEKGKDIFERFYKLNSFRQGTGLGLAICRSVADLLGGKVSLDTTYTGGARFVFRLKEDHD